MRARIDGMKSDLFASGNLAETSAVPGMTLQNAKSVKYAVDGEVLARQGSMVAFRGDLRFERKGRASAACSGAPSRARGSR